MDPQIQIYLRKMSLESDSWAVRKNQSKTSGIPEMRYLWNVISRALLWSFLLQQAKNQVILLSSYKTNNFFCGINFAM